MSFKGIAKTIDAKDVSPAWKVLKMKLSEEKANKEQDMKKNKGENESSRNKHPFMNRQNSRKRNLEKVLDEQKNEIKKSRQDADIPVLINDFSMGEITPILAIDCEYVGGGTDGRDDILARVSIVNQEGKVVYDKYVKPKERVTDYRTAVSGIRPMNLNKGLSFQTVQMETAKIIKDRIVVGHALNNDFRVLNLNHNRKLTRDTSRCTILRKMANCDKLPSLKRLAKDILGIDVQQGEHNSIIDARVALRLYLSVKKKWENEIKRYHSSR